MVVADVIATFSSQITEFIWKQFIHLGLMSCDQSKKNLSFIRNKKEKPRGSLLDGEFSVLVRIDLSTLKSETLQSIADDLVALSIEWDLPIQRCFYQSNEYVIQVNRCAIYRTFIGRTHELKENYGTCALSPDDEAAIVVAHFLHDGELSRSAFRSLLLSEHIRLLMEAGGRRCQIYLPCVTEKIRTQVERYGLKIATRESLAGDFDGNLREKELDSIRKSLASRQNAQTENKNHCTENKDECSEGDKLKDKRLAEIVDLRVLSNKPQTVLHVVGADREVQHRKLLSRIDCPGSSHECRRFLVYNRVITRLDLPEQSLSSSISSSISSSMSSLETFIELRREQTREVSVVKYGDEARGPEWQSRIDQLTMAAIKFELLSTSCQSEVKLDLTTYSRMGATVLYNYARLANLFRKFQSDVANGTYPPLPDLADMDFSNLTSEVEWDLMIKFVIPYESLIHQILGNTQLSKSNIQTHKICQFLYQLCRVLSPYYNAHHILGASRLHLYPRMYACLCLLQAVQQVMKNALMLLNIVPLEQM